MDRRQNISYKMLGGRWSRVLAAAALFFIGTVFHPSDAQAKTAQLQVGRPGDSYPFNCQPLDYVIVKGCNQDNYCDATWDTRTSPGRLTKGDTWFTTRSWWWKGTVMAEMHFTDGSSFPNAYQIPANNTADIVIVQCANVIGGNKSR